MLSVSISLTPKYFGINSMQALISHSPPQKFSLFFGQITGLFLFMGLFLGTALTLSISEIPVTITRETVSEHLGKGGSGTLPDLNQVQKELERSEI